MNQYSFRLKPVLSFGAPYKFNNEQSGFYQPSASVGHFHNIKTKKFSTETNFSKKCLAAALAASSLMYFYKKKVAYSEHAKNIKPGLIIDNLPYYKMSDVAKHNNKENGIWVVYKNGVYNVTDFVEEHPGGNKILLAAGSSIEPFWALYAIHNTEEVYGMLEKLRIGNIEIDETDAKVNISDPYAKDPKRHPILKAASEKPFNAEPAPPLLVDHFYTPK